MATAVSTFRELLFLVKNYWQHCASVILQVVYEDEVMQVNMLDIIDGTTLLIRKIMSSDDDSEKEDTTSSDEDIIVIATKLRKKPVHIKRFVERIVPYYDDVDFQSYFRLTREVVEKFLLELEMTSIKGSVGRPAVKSKEALLLTLWVLGNQECFSSVANRFGFNRGHAHNIFIKTIQILYNNRCNYIKWPDGTELLNCVKDFDIVNGKNSFPNVVGCVDVTHIPIPEPRDDNSYYNRQGSHSMIIQGICDSKMVFMDIFCGWPGSASDYTVWKESPIYAMLKDDLLPDEYHILGDMAYPLDKFIMVPFRDNSNLDQQQKNFNQILNNSRVVIEQAFAHLKSVWKRLQYLNIENHTYFKYIVVAACIFHNVCIQENINTGECDTCDDEFDEVLYKGYVSVDARNKRDKILNSLK